MMRRALVTGGLGFIGSALARRLRADGAEVRVLDNLDPAGGGREFHAASGAEVLRGDVRDAALLRRAVDGVDAVFHLAALTSHAGSMREPLVDLAVNAEGTLALLEAVRERAAQARVVFTSTRQVYGRVTRLPVPESQPTDPLDCNGVSKLAAEGYCAVYARVHGVRSVVLRLTNIYGPGMRIADARQMFLGLWLRKALSGEALQVFGDGAQRRDLVHVDDAVDALVRAAAAPAPAPVYNLGGADTVALGDLAERLSSAAGGLRVERVPFPAERRAIDIGDYHGDWSLIRDQLGWSPRVPLDDGLARTLAYYREHHARYL